MKTICLYLAVFILLITRQAFSQEIQWASAVNYDSEITNKDQFNARMAIGAPDAKTYGEASKRCATANKQKNAQLWVDFKTPQEATQIFIIENNSCGNIVKIELLDEDGTGTPVYEKPAEPSAAGYRLFSVLLPEKTRKIKTIKIKISGMAAKAEPQIDAIGILDGNTKYTFDELVKKYNTNSPSFSKTEDASVCNYEVNFDKKNINVLNVKKDMGTLMKGLKPGESGNLGGKVNSEYDEIAPIISPDEKTLFFIRSGHPKNYSGGEDIWYSEWNKNDTSWGVSQHMGAPFNKDNVNKVVGITPDGNTMLIKGAYKNGVSEGLGFSFTKRIIGGWSIPEKIKLKSYDDMVKGIYVGSYYANDGKTLLLSFSEDKESEFNDIYVSFRKDDGSWTKPMNLGKNFNTSYKEDTPFLASDGVTLYFSSDRPGGLGKRDIYFSKRLDDTWLNWGPAVNLGSTINTVGDDANYSIAASGYYAYMVSTRNAIGGSDIVRIKLKDEIKPNPVVLISGKVINTKTKEYVDANILYQFLPGGAEAGIARSNPNNGDYKIVLPYGKNYSFNAGANGYIAVSDNLDLTNISEYKEITRDLYLVPVEIGETIRLNNIFFETAKWDLLPESFVELDKLVKILNDNPAMEITISGHTDNVGNDDANKTLSAYRAKAVVDYLVTKGVAAPRLQQEGFGESKPLSTNDTDEGRALNRRVEFTINKK